MKVCLYTLPTCPICSMIKTKLNSKKIDFIEKDLSYISGLINVNRAPVLDVGDGTYLTSPTVMVDWINKQEG